LARIFQGYIPFFCKKKPPTSLMNPDIGTAWLLLSHSGFLGAMLITNSIGFAFLVTEKTILNENGIQALCIMWCVLSLLIGLWTIYAIRGTWCENRKIASPVYGDIGFISLICIVISIMATSSWTISEISR
jgi:hypothetical protein